MTDMINDDEDFQQFEASGNTVTDSGNYPENNEWNSGDGMNSDEITNDGLTNPEVLDNSEILDSVKGFNTNNNNNWDGMTTDTNKLNELTTDSLSELVSGATKNIENIDSSSCEGGWFKCLTESIEQNFEQMDQMTILVILLSVCVLI